MQEFIRKHEGAVLGVLSGWDRVRFMGTLRMLSCVGGMMTYLSKAGVLLKDFGGFVESKSDGMKEAIQARARELGRPVVYLASSRICKEEIALGIAQKDGVKDGLVCVLSAVEPCMSYLIGKDAARKRLVLKAGLRKCLHLYGYGIDETFGWMSIRIQTWFPFTVQVCVNGREWLARQMDRAGIGYERRDNCFARISDLPKAQALMEKMHELNWPEELERVVRALNPLHGQMIPEWPMPTYWSARETEWATDVMFRSEQELASIYPALVRSAIHAYSSPDVMRFLGKKLTGHFQGEIQSSYKHRPEGIRVKHRVKGNSIKVYDKQGSVLRTETTINDPRDFKVYRAKEGDSNGEKRWRVLRRGVADLHRRAMVSQAANERYLDALAALDTSQSFGDLLRPECRAVIYRKRKVRGLRPWADEDQALLTAISRGEFAMEGFRNKDLAVHLGLGKLDPKKASARISRLLRILRAHQIIRKSPGCHRYFLTPKGRVLAAAVLQVQVVTLQQVARAAA
ncbi:MAG: hypothetical protein EPO02_02930 [Nitrospirae bacterium]|nr:MAG: hypothetical protein EPO02_02930 [Nitrospirota bacterium]